LGVAVLGGLVFFFGLLTSTDKPLMSGPAVWGVVSGLVIAVVMGVLVAAAAKRG
jgi:hypothetical protein